MDEKEYIERESAYKDMLNAMCGTGYQSRALDVIAYAPAADVVPIKHGHWISENFYTHCSVCGKMAIYDKYGQEFESDYCPNCGAKMSGGD